MEQLPEFSKAEQKDLAKFFESELGQKYIQRLKVSRFNWLIATTQASTAEKSFACANVANGVGIVISDMELVIEQMKDEKGKGETEKAD